MFFESLSFTKMKATPRWELPSFLPRGLSAEVERLDDGAVALDVDLFQILQQRAALTDQAQQCALGSEVVFVALEVFCKVADTVRKQRDLALRRTRVGVRLAVLAEKLLLFSLLLNKPFLKVYLNSTLRRIPLTVDNARASGKVTK